MNAAPATGICNTVAAYQSAQLSGEARSTAIQADCTPNKRQAAPAMYLAKRPHSRQRSVTWQRGGGGKSVGVRSIWPEQDGQLSGAPVRSLAIRWRACAGLNVAGLGLRICCYLATTSAPRMDNGAG